MLPSMRFRDAMAYLGSELPHSARRDHLLILLQEVIRACRYLRLCRCWISGDILERRRQPTVCAFLAEVRRWPAASYVASSHECTYRPGTHCGWPRGRDDSISFLFTEVLRDRIPGIRGFVFPRSNIVQIAAVIDEWAARGPMLQLTPPWTVTAQM